MQRSVVAGEPALANAIDAVQQQVRRILRYSGGPEETDAVSVALSLIETHGAQPSVLARLDSLADSMLSSGGWPQELELVGAVTDSLHGRDAGQLALDFVASRLQRQGAAASTPSAQAASVGTRTGEATSGDAVDANRSRHLALRAVRLEIQLRTGSTYESFDALCESLIEHRLGRFAQRLHVARSIASVEAGRYEQAIADIESARSLAVESTDFVAYTSVSLWLFLVHERRGDLEAAFSTIVRAVASLEQALSAVDPDIVRIRSWLESLPQRWGAEEFERVAREHVSGPRRE